MELGFTAGSYSSSSYQPKKENCSFVADGTCMSPQYLGGWGRGLTQIQGQLGLHSKFQASQHYTVRPWLTVTKIEKQL